MRHTTFALLALLVLTVASPAGAYTVVDGHPRIYFRAADVPGLRAKCAGAMASDFNVMRGWADDHIDDSPAVDLDSILPMYAFLWQMTGDSRYAERGKEIVQYVIDSGDIQSDTFARGGAIFFDWCYDYLTSSERQSFGAALATSAQYHIDTNNWDLMDNYHSKPRWLRRLSYPGLALYEAGVNDALAVTLCDMAREHTFGDSYALCAIDEVASDGSYFEGDYTHTVLAEKFREHCEAWASATDENPFDESGNFRNMAKYYLYEIFGRTGTGVDGTLRGSRQGDSHHHSAPAAAIRIAMYNLASRYQDPLAQWLGDEIDAIGLGYVLRWDRWKLIVWKDLDLVPHSPTELPDAWHFEDIGTVYMRSGWDYSSASDDVYAVFRCEGYPAGHTHAHQNHFLIARGDDLLAVDSGTYDTSESSHHHNYFERTIAHNTITVYQPGETTFGSYSNDGGQVPPSNFAHGYHCGYVSQPENFRGDVVAYTYADSFVRAKGDATAAYSPSKVSLFVREFVWVKPDIFVVFDRVAATSPSYRKAWPLHSIGEPTLVGDTIVVQEGESKLFVKPLLPDPYELVKVGGPGREFEVDGTNYPPSVTPGDDAGQWRIEVSPATDANEHLFLHVLYVADASATSMPDVALIDDGEMIGADIGGHVVLFSKTGETVPGATYEWSGPAD